MQQRMNSACLITTEINVQDVKTIPKQQLHWPRQYLLSTQMSYFKLLTFINLFPCCKHLHQARKWLNNSFYLLPWLITWENFLIVLLSSLIITLFKLLLWASSLLLFYGHQSHSSTRLWTSFNFFLYFFGLIAWNS